MDDDRSLENEPEEEETAAQAFEAMRREMALVRRAVEQLAAERADIIIPDYSATLADISKRLSLTAQGMNTLAGKPAMEITPETMAARIESAAVRARRSDQAQLTDAQMQFERAARDLGAMVSAARSAYDQMRRVRWATAGGMVAGMLLWAVLPGMVARTVPQSWLWPERLAARTLRLDMWDAGEQLLARADPLRWETIIRANRILQDNREAISTCSKAANRSGKVIRCALKIQR